MTNLDIKGFMKTSLLDYPGKIASVIFLPSCSFHCPYCHNKELVLNDPRLVSFEEIGILTFLENKKKWIDGVVVSGGEPTIHSGLPDFLIKLKKLGYLIKLDTNGTNPNMLKQLLDEKLIDYVAMDIKSSKKNYAKATAVKVDIEKIEQSIDLIINSSIDYEFRTTIVPGLINMDDILSIGEWIKGSKKYYLQQFVQIKTLNDSYMDKTPYPNPILREMMESIKENFEICEVRGI